jgi:hypothetical protein
MSIADQIRGVFTVYGIATDPRHLSLIAVFMMYDGDYLQTDESKWDVGYQFNLPSNEL